MSTLRHLLKGFGFYFKYKGRALFSEMKCIMGDGILFYQRPNFYFLLLPPKQIQIKTHILTEDSIQVKYPIGSVSYRALSMFP